MPIYAYRCTSCGHAKDVLQKLSEPALTVCPACGAATFSKQVTAAGFQLKGSGWYATDFKNTAPAKKAGDSASGDGKSGEGKSGEGAPDTTKPDGAKPTTAADAGSSPSTNSGGTEPKAGAAGGAARA